MATQSSEEQGNSNHAEPPADIEAVRVSIKSASSGIESVSSESRGTPGISENVNDVLYYRPLLRAVFRGDWEYAKRYFEQDPGSKTTKITSRSETVLHIAALSAQDQFLENLVELLSVYPAALEEVDCDGCTALHNAVRCGRIRMVKALVRSNPKLTQLADTEGRVPFGISALEASMHKDIAWFLAKSTTDDGPSHPFSSPSAIDFILELTYAGHHDITLYLVGQYPYLLTMKNTKNRKESILDVLAMMQSHFPSGTRLSVLESLIYKCIPVDLSYKPTDKSSDPAPQCCTRPLWNATKIVVPIIERMHEVKLRHVAAVKLAERVCIEISSTGDVTHFIQQDMLFSASTTGISELVKLCIQFFPELIWISPLNRNLTIAAVHYRQERILGLFLKKSSTKKLSSVPVPTWPESRDMMNFAAKYNPHDHATANVSGAAFELQRELQWFKALESWLAPALRVKELEGQNEGKLYWELFLEEHKILLEKGEKWVRDTANSCMLVSTLIATVLFVAAFTMPGGNNENTGVPLLLRKDSFMIFIISDAIGLFSSVTAILLFLAILTSRYEPQDFLESLPKKIIMDLSLLSVSLAFMLVAFAATLTIVLDKKLEWILIPITLLASLPVALFILLQLPLLYQMVKSTYGRSIFHPDSIWE